MMLDADVGCRVDEGSLIKPVPNHAQAPGITGASRVDMRQGPAHLELGPGSTAILGGADRTQCHRRPLYRLFKACAKDHRPSQIWLGLRTVLLVYFINFGYMKQYDVPIFGGVKHCDVSFSCMTFEHVGVSDILVVCDLHVIHALILSCLLKGAGPRSRKSVHCCCFTQAVHQRCL